LAPHFFRRWSADADPVDLLKSENQWSTPWGDAGEGPCDKCEGRGRVTYRCLSCADGDHDPGCPACGGRVRYTDVCPACEGDGTIDHTRRRGVSVFPSIGGLYRYIARQDAEPEDCVVELEGRLTGERDLDADAGALLVEPTRIVAVHPFDQARVESLKASAREL
jgi:hypothetical protein